MRLDHPAVLLAALPVLLAILLLARRGAAPVRRPALSFALRLLILLCLATVVAAPSIAARRPGPSVVFALDVSDSVSDEALERAVAAVRDASQAVADRGGESTLILYAGRAVVARPSSRDPVEFSPDLRRRIFARRDAQEAASQDRAPSPGVNELDPLKTRSASAVRLARRTHRPDARILLITDGRETEPGTPASEGARIIRLPDARSPEVALRALRAPLAVRAGEAFDVEVDAWADRDLEARLSLTLDGQVVAEDATLRTVRAGRSTLRIPSVQNALPQGLHRLQAVISSETDSESRNNSASATFNVVGKSKLLIVEATPAEGEGLSKLLSAQGIEFERRSLTRLATGGIDLDRWAVVVIAGAMPGAIPPSAAKALGSWLENGGGLFYVASSAPAAPESFNRPEFTELLPVEIEPPKPADKPEGGPAPPGPNKPPPGPAPVPQTRTVMAPAVALLLILDKSGSMAGDPITLCKEAAIATLETLGEKDFLGVLAFDRQAVWLQPFEAAHRTELIKRNILQLYADGGTDLLPALKEAGAAFRNQANAKDAGVKHIIVLSDGETPAGEYQKTVTELARDGIVVSTVCVVGPGGFRDLVMRNIAGWGRGRYFFADSFQKIPRIFTEETKFVLKEAAAKADAEPKAPPAASDPPPPPAPDATTPPEAVTPGARGKVIFKDEHEVLRGIPRNTPPPPLVGALAGKARRTSYVPLAIEGGTPALALWRYGLGRAAVWMSEIGGPWSAGWEQWPSTTKLFVQIVRHLSNAAEDLGLASAVRAERKGDSVEFRVDGDVTVHEISPGRRELPLAPDPERIRRFVLDLTGPEVRQVSIARSTEDRSESFMLEYSPGAPPEIAPPPDAPVPFAWTSEGPAPLERLTAEAVQAGSSESAPRVPIGAFFVLAAVILLPLDVAVRRLV